MTKFKYLAVAISMVAFNTASAGIEERITDLENQLNQCRNEYKAQVEKTNQEIQNLKKKASGNLDRVYKEKKNKLQQKANSCKEIKSLLTAEIEFKQRVDTIKTTNPIAKAGPSFRCLRLRQNWTEFQACAESLGMESSIGKTNSGNTAFFAGRDVTSIIDSTNHVSEIIVRNAEFWNAEAIDNSFLMAFVKKYDVDNFLPDQNMFGILQYNGTVSGGKISIVPTQFPIGGHVSLTYTKSDSGYAF